MRLPETLAILVCVALLVVALLASSRREPTEPAPELPLEQYAGEIRDTQGPLSYFINNCARCHGPMEDAYKEFATPRHGEALREMIVIMANGPAMAPLDEPSLQQQFDLHMAILERKPYVWIDPAVTDAWAVETMPDAVVTLITAEKRIQAMADGHLYVLPREPGIIEARWLDKTTRVKP